MVLKRPDSPRAREDLFELADARFRSAADAVFKSATAPIILGSESRFGASGRGEAERRLPHRLLQPVLDRIADPEAGKR